MAIDTKNKLDNVKGCPFCGRKPKVTINLNDLNNKVHVSCDGFPDCHANIFVIENDLETALEVWNRRV